MRKQYNLTQVDFSEKSGHAAKTVLVQWVSNL
jgi:hypothetical protein